VRTAAILNEFRRLCDGLSHNELFFSLLKIGEPAAVTGSAWGSRARCRCRLRE
jgi:hypothetical protein